MFIATHLIGFGDAPYVPRNICTMTAGTDGDVQLGYSSVYFGSISNEPMLGLNLTDLIYTTAGYGGICAFAFDATALLAGLTVWINGVEYPFDVSDWSYLDWQESTWGTWSNAATPVFVNGVTYNVEFK